MPNEAEAITIRFADDFEANLYALAKRYRSIRNDVQPVIEQLQAGNFIGDRIPGMGEDYIILKVRVKNSNIQKGKSAGYRLIYQVELPSVDRTFINHLLKIRSNRYQPQRNPQHHSRV